MKKFVQEIKKKSMKDIEKESMSLREEITKMRLDMVVNPQKDTNFLVKKRKRLAVLSTVLNEMRDEEAIKTIHIKS